MGKGRPGSGTFYETAGANPDATTQADVEWPVPGPYRIDASREVEEESDDRTPGVPSYRRNEPLRVRGLPVAAVIAAVVALLIVVGAGAVWLVMRTDARPTASRHLHKAAAAAPKGTGGHTSAPA